MLENQWDWRGLWLGLPRIEKRYLRVAFILLCSGVVWGVGGWIFRYDFSEAIVPLTFQEERIESIQEVEINFRTYLIEAPVRQAFEVDAVDILLPRWQSFGVGWALVVIGWAALLAAATRAEGFLPYLVYFAWAAWVFLSGSAQSWAGVDPFYIVSLGLALVVLLPIYLVGAGIWQLRLGPTALLSLFLVGGVLGLPALWRGPVVLYDGLSLNGVLTYAAGGVVGLQIPIALLTVLVYPSAVRRRGMIGLSMILGVGVGLIILLVFLPLEEAYTLAVLLMAGGTLLALVGLQPYYPILGSSLRHPAAFFWGWVGLGLISLGAFGYHGWNHQDIYTYRMAGLWRAMLVGGTGGIMLYLVWNFLPLWRIGAMTYWDLARSARLPLALVYFLSLGSTIFVEAQNDWPTTRLPARLYAVSRAESALIAGRWDEAEALYREALYLLPYEAKINYNLGRLEAQRREAVERATERYERSILSKPFLPAALQASVVWLAMDRPLRALQLLQRYYHRFGGDAGVCNQLAYAFYKVGQLDSAAYYWKEAIRRAPGEPRAYAHLAILYARYDKPTWAATVARHIVEWKSLSPATQENLAYLRLRGLLKEGRFRGWNAQWLGMDEDTTALGRFISAIRRYKFEDAMGALAYFKENDPELAPRVARQLGLMLLRIGSSRRAAEIFLSAGTPVDSLYAGYALAESQCWDAAYALISRLWGTYPELEAAARREIALLLMAAGRPQETSLLEPAEGWSDSDFLRFGYYAYLRGDIQSLVAVLRPWIDRGAVYDAPYEWVARLFLAQKDTSGAEENIQSGLSRVPHSVRLRLLKAEMAYRRGEISSFQSLLNSTRFYLRTMEDSLRWSALSLEHASSATVIQNFLSRFPYYVPAQVRWTQLLLADGKVEEAHEFVSKALDVNPYVPELWRLYAETAERLGMKEEADFARKKPDPCPSVL
ncbi:MAG: hypothetical protein N3E49_00365 [Bacteroidia bacterium]|nr:hypothetical protein [Bacteroidia bacterium]